MPRWRRNFLPQDTRVFPIGNPSVILQAKFAKVKRKIPDREFPKMDHRLRCLLMSFLAVSLYFAMSNTAEFFSPSCGSPGRLMLERSSDLSPLADVFGVYILRAIGHFNPDRECQSVEPGIRNCHSRSASLVS